MITVRQVQNPTADELDAAARVAADAFAQDSATMISLGGDSSLLFAFERAVLAAAAIGGELYTASYEDTAVAGVAAWFPPGQDPFSTDEQRNAGFNQLFSSISHELTSWWMDDFLPKWEEQVRTSLGKGVKTASWHLQLVAVASNLQGRGIGTALIDVGEAKAKQNGSLVCLETGSEAMLPCIPTKAMSSNLANWFMVLRENSTIT